jgi:gelsolin
MQGQANAKSKISIKFRSIVPFPSLKSKNSRRAPRWTLHRHSSRFEGRQHVVLCPRQVILPPRNLILDLRSSPNALRDSTMPPHQGLVHPEEYDWRDSNVELINSHLDHRIKHQSAATEPAWNNGLIGTTPGLYIWRIEDFEVVARPTEKYGSFHEGDSYIILQSEKVTSRNGDSDAHVDAPEEKDKLVHDIFFWLGNHTSQDEAGTAAYKTVELDEYLNGSAIQHRELQTSPSDAFSALFPRLKILRGGVKSGFTHVQINEEARHTDTLLRVFKCPSTATGRNVMVHEVEPRWQSLDEEDVFVLDRGDKIWVWQGRKCSPMEKARAAQVVNDLTLAKHVNVEVLAQSEARSRVVVDYLGGEDVGLGTIFKCERPLVARDSKHGGRPKMLWKLSDSGGELTFELIKKGENIGKEDLDGDDVFLLDSKSGIWVWEGKGASCAEKAMWLKVTQMYVRQHEDAASLSVAKVVQGCEGRGFWTAVEA